MRDKLFKIRVQLYYTNSKSYNAGCEDVFVVAANRIEGERIIYEYFLDYYQKNNIQKRIAGFISGQEVDGFIQVVEKPLTRKVYIEKVFKTRPLHST
jgi:hypothetical protein